jgi:hypothetical protein
MSTEQNLREAMNLALQEYREASGELKVVVTDMPMGVGSDGVLLLQRAGTKCREASRRYLEALTRYNDFVQNGLKGLPS